MILNTDKIITIGKGEEKIRTLGTVKLEKWTISNT